MKNLVPKICQFFFFFFFFIKEFHLVKLQKFYKSLLFKTKEYEYNLPRPSE